MIAYDYGKVYALRCIAQSAETIFIITRTAVSSMKMLVEAIHMKNTRSVRAHTGRLTAYFKFSNVFRPGSVQAAAQWGIR
jgi:hypothetical protein